MKESSQHTDFKRWSTSSNNHSDIDLLNASHRTRQQRSERGLLQSAETRVVEIRMSILCADNVSSMGRNTAKYKEFSESTLSPLI
jgi:hypothetical protein